MLYGCKKEVKGEMTMGTGVMNSEKRTPDNIVVESLGLTRREVEVLAWVTNGKTNIEIGLILGRSPKTVQKHLEHIFEKLGVATRTAAAVRAIGLISSQAPHVRLLQPQYYTAGGHR